jgi:acyl-CoA thioesterase I
MLVMGVATLAVAFGGGAVWLPRVLAVRRAVARYAAHWASAGPRPVGALELVALGDSAAQAVGATAPGRGWVGQVADHLRRVTGRPVHVVNLSRSGARVADVVTHQLPLLADRSPDLVVVAVGGNDILDKWDPQALGGQIDALVAGLPANTVIGDVPYFMHGRWQRRALAAAQMVHDSARRRGLPVAAVHAAMRAHGCWSAMTRHYSADFFHPNDRGYQVWAGAFIDAITASPALIARLTEAPAPVPAGRPQAAGQM